MARRISIATMVYSITADGKPLARTLRNQRNQLKQWSRAANRHANLVRVAIAGVGTALVTRKILDAVNYWGKYRASISDVAAKTGVAVASLNGLSDKIREAAKVTKFTAQQAGEAATFLAQAGQTVTQISGSIRPVLDIAAATGTAVQNTADIITNIQMAMGISVKDLARAGDTLALATARSNVNLVEIGESMKYAAATARPLKLSLEETTAIIGQLGNMGIKGSMAGTFFRMSLAALAGGTIELSGDVTDANISLSKQEEVLTRLGVRIHDGAGGLRKFTDILRDLGTAGADVGDMIKLFGTRAGTTASLLAGTITKVSELDGVLQGAAGSASEMATKQMDNLAGESKLLTSQLGELKIAFAEAGAGKFARDITTTATAFAKKMTPAVEALGKWMKPLVASTAAFVGVIAGVAMAKGIVALTALTAAMLANPIGLIAAAVAALVLAFVQWGPQIIAFGKTLWDGIVDTMYKVRVALVAGVNWLYEKMVGGIERVVLRIQYNIAKAQNAIARGAQKVGMGWMAPDTVPLETTFSEYHKNRASTRGSLLDEPARPVYKNDEPPKVGGLGDGIDDTGDAADDLKNKIEGVGKIVGEVVDDGQRRFVLWSQSFDQVGDNALRSFGAMNAGYGELVEKQRDLAEQSAKGQKVTAQQTAALTLDTFSHVLSQGAKKSKTLARLQKVLAIGTAIRNTAQGITSALALGPKGIPLAVLIGIQGGLQIQTIRQTPVMGQAHDGVASIPSAGSWILEQGERVVPVQTNDRLENFLEQNIQPPAQAQPINFHLTAMDSRDVRERIAEQAPLIENIVRAAQRRTATNPAF